MKRSLLASLISLTLATCAPAEEGGIAVVELFTSQGCSSCPPADVALAELHDWATDQGKPVYCLSFHVDYWNRLGWTDPYSQAEFSGRQSSYARSRGSSQVYTPQMIVNGTEEFVGSDRRASRAAVQSALAKAVTGVIKIEAKIGANPGEIEVSYQVDGADGQLLNLALVQREATNDVPAGENSGRHLSHRQVVRAFRSVEAGAGRATFRLPEGLPAEGFEVIGYTQRAPGGTITGAARASLAL